MAFFSLTTHQEHQQRGQIGPEGFFSYRNSGDSNSLYKGFEFRQPQQHQQHQQFQEYDFYTPLRGLTIGSGQGSGLRGPDDGPSGSGLEMMMRGGGVDGGAGTISCQDCGNQAKKDCIHMRCRTCCKSRGFNCQTHVKSTWVPAAVRRDKHHHHQQSEAQSHREIPKRQRDKGPGSSSTGLQAGEFPAEFTAPATFRCVRVSSINDADEEYAYQTAVNIGGHVFRGILYDQGPNNVTPAVETSTGAGEASQAVALFDTPNYPSPLGTFISGTSFFYNPRS